jgi:hypothetical protein
MILIPLIMLLLAIIFQIVEDELFSKEQDGLITNLPHCSTFGLYEFSRKGNEYYDFVEDIRGKVYIDKNGERYIVEPKTGRTVYEFNSREKLKRYDLNHNNECCVVSEGNERWCPIKLNTTNRGMNVARWDKRKQECYAVTCTLEFGSYVYKHYSVNRYMTYVDGVYTFRNINSERKITLSEYLDLSVDKYSFVPRSYYMGEE